MIKHAPKQAPDKNSPLDRLSQATLKLFILLDLNGAPGEIRTPDLLIRSQNIHRVYWENGDYCRTCASFSASFVEGELAHESRERR